MINDLTVKKLASLCSDPYSLSEEILFGITLLLECSGEGILGQMAVANVIHNRVVRWKTTYHKVILQPKQFSCWNDLDWAMNRLVKENDKIFRQCLWVTKGILRGWVNEDVSRGADHYFAHDIVTPEWFDKTKVTVKILRHTFLRLIWTKKYA